MTPLITVGILTAHTVRFSIEGAFALNGRSVPPGHYEAVIREGRIQIGSDAATKMEFTPLSADSLFTLHDVVIGIQFHWQRHQSQSFRGALKLIMDSEMITAINAVDIETYLQSVVSSEMNARACPEYIKAHAILSRSWLLAQLDPDESLSHYTCTATPDETVRWYDRQAHTLFNVCADDHCQRYQGCTRANPDAVRAVEATAGEVLTFAGRLCDARFSKCCGGVTERFSTCWQPVDYPYLRPVTDAPDNPAVPDLTDEAEATRWILSTPPAYCAAPGREVLESVLNDFDRETNDFYRWQVDYTADQLADIVRRRAGIDFGHIMSLTPLHRGASGRIDRLEIRGSHRTMVIGKELEIRRILSESHLYSSAFVATPHDPDVHGVPARWTIRGAGWGHGVGLCQIGAAAMAYDGYDYRSILAHYFPGAEISKAY